MFMKTLPLLPSTLLAAAWLATPSEADACGCFAPPDPSVPVVQAGERIVFALEGRHVVAHIQIQYEGAAEEFGWLLPVPSVPEFSLGTEELFTRVLNSTQPRYRLNRTFSGQCQLESSAGGGFGRDQDSSFDAGAPNDGGVVVVEDSAGPFDYAVLRAHDRQEMFDWLDENRYFVPAGTDDVVEPYIAEGSYFLALKLKSGETAGDIQPIVLRYESDYPMIPIILTSVAANPDMGIQVWVLGEHRAIPRNYRHTILNDEMIDWFNGAANYNDVIIAATNEAPDGQSFVTEFSGSTDRMKNVLSDAGRFGTEASLAEVTNPVEFVESLWERRFPFDATTTSLLERDIPVPALWTERGVDAPSFFGSMRFYVNRLKEEAPEAHEAYLRDLGFDPQKLAADLFERVAEPIRRANELFDRHPVMTRLYTTLSPREMTKDPVFAFNPDLPEVSNEHEATFVQDCNSNGGFLELPDGRTLRVAEPFQWADNRAASGVPFSRRVETLWEEGVPQIEIDNRNRVSQSYDEAGACACTNPRQPGAPFAAMLLLIGGLLPAWYRRRA
ncbi:MAG: DUF2330 domain-containing protein [Myxococcales bacterium]|nr:DUF2330 domain-containing protein [Myxococcales bacterium]